MIVIVCGGRKFRDYKSLFAALNALRPTELIHGDYGNADTAADVWAILNGFEPGKDLHRFPPDWEAHGRAAGPLRNQQVADREPRADVCLSMPGGKGTSDMRDKAFTAGIKVMQWPWDFRDWNLEEKRAQIVDAPWLPDGLEEDQAAYAEPLLSKLMGERL